uniref:hypothetical protein n=1 Tax=Candidatus Electrothrix sp. TaxID=2170559 RepID=UPI004055FA70
MKQHRGHKNFLLKFTFFIILTIIFSGCGRHYQKIPYTWTSDHRIPPHERILSLNASPQAVFNALQQWVKDLNGDISMSTNDYRYAYHLPEQSAVRFQKLQSFTQKYWESYDENTYLKWDNTEWATLKELTDAQITKTSAETPGFVLEAKLAERTGTFNYKEQTGTKQSYLPIVSGGFTAYQSTGSGFRSFSAPTSVMVMPTTVPVYEKREKSIAFASSVSFFIYTHDTGTNVYASGTPFEKTGTRTSYHSNIGHAWWPYITGKEEAELIREAYAFLSKLNRTGELAQYASGTKEQADESSSSIAASNKLIAEIDESTIVNSTFRISPDGERIAYASGVGDMRIVTIDGHEENWYDGLAPGHPIFSPDSRHVAYIAKTGDSFVVVVDGKEGREYDNLGNGSLVFSPDSDHIAYTASTGDKWFVVIDGKEKAHYDDVANNLTFSPDSRHLAYIAKTDNKLHAVFDGKEERHYDNIALGSLTLSPDSQRIAYMASTGKKWFAVVDGREEQPYDNFGKDTLIFSPDSQRIAYVASTGNKWFAVVDRKEEQPYDNFGKDTLIFSPDSQHLAYLAKTGNKWHAVIDGKQGLPYDNLGNGSSIFSPDSQHVAYLANDGNKWFVVFDGKEMKHYDGIANDLTFSFNSELIAYSAKSGNKWFTVIDGKEGKHYDVTAKNTLTFSPDSRHFAYAAREGNKWFLVMDGKERGRYDRIISTNNLFDSPETLHYLTRNYNSFYLVKEDIK